MAMPEKRDMKALKGTRPAWWEGKNGGPPLVPEIMPEADSTGRHSFSGKEMEEWIWNLFDNKKWVAKEADLFVGGGKGAAVRRIQVWDAHKRLWEGSTRAQRRELGVLSAQLCWWVRYHNFVERGGDAVPDPRILAKYGKYQPGRRGAITAMCA